MLKKRVKLNLSVGNARRNKNTNVAEYGFVVGVALELMNTHRRMILHFQGGNHSREGNYQQQIGQNSFHKAKVTESFV